MQFFFWRFTLRMFSEIDERIMEELMIDLVGSSSRERENPAASDTTSRHRGESEEEGKNRKEEQKKKADERLVAFGFEFFRVYHSCFTIANAMSIWEKYEIPNDFVIQVPATDDHPKLSH
ncbi:UNVERIFIED_CONTAM: hypothetical protein Sradi_3262300 [Sesamum radiatum]|uniref:Uncharacterized protein n=1 Tax=Sesamum radiatum TaxID=300843 RepID=A0AAW2R1E8_SESRA